MATVKKTEALKRAALLLAIAGGAYLADAAITKTPAPAFLGILWLTAAILIFLFPTPTQYKIATVIHAIWKTTQRPINWITRQRD